LKTIPVQRKEKSDTVSAEPRPLAPASKAKIKSRMYSLFEHAKRHKLCTANPIETVRQGSKRLIKPAILTLDEIRAIMMEIPNHAIRFAVLVAGVTGLRRSEIRGLKWNDVDSDAHWLTTTQGSVRAHVTNLKTRASGESIPIPQALSEAFPAWRERVPTVPTTTGCSLHRQHLGVLLTGLIPLCRATFGLRQSEPRSRSGSAGIPLGGLLPRLHASPHRQLVGLNSSIELR
jgi:integrase